MDQSNEVREIIEGQFINVFNVLVKVNRNVHILVLLTDEVRKACPFIKSGMTENGVDYFVLNIGPDSVRDMTVTNAQLLVTMLFSGTVRDVRIDLEDIVRIYNPGADVGYNTNGIWITTADGRTSGYVTASSRTPADAVKHDTTSAKRTSHLTVVK